ncbi:hypothetical protein [Subtercola sp. YIM 133946]|uniref:hypothetical protein n=1 Tax=Subtercola sp. YIM 133946 TaxID=3118909 RepID=UPI002F95C180
MAERRSARGDTRDGCAALCAMAASLAAQGPGGRRYLVEFGRRGAGIPAGPLWFVAAATGGRNPLRGRGFAASLDDGSTGQARHFAGIVASVARLGPRATRWLSVHVRRDALDSADGRLTECAIEFATIIRSGELDPADAPDWLRAHLCAAPAE